VPHLKDFPRAATDSQEHKEQSYHAETSCYTKVLVMH